jgi:hypothetical protein
VSEAVERVAGAHRACGRFVDTDYSHFFPPSAIPVGGARREEARESLQDSGWPHRIAVRRCRLSELLYPVLYAVVLPVTLSNPVNRKLIILFQIFRNICEYIWHVGQI